MAGFAVNPWAGLRSAVDGEVPGSYDDLESRFPLRIQGTMMENPHRIEVYQELAISFDTASHEDARAALERLAFETAWHRATVVEERIEGNYVTGGVGVLAFERGEESDALAVRVVLWPADEDRDRTGKGRPRYRVANVVPVEPGKLEVHDYNNALEGFLRDVVEPAGEALGIEIQVSSREQTMTDWTSKEAAEALRLFSAAANMSTGADHPADEARWWKFVIADHRAQGTLHAGLLRQWLVEADRWPPEIASELVSDWEKYRGLLAAYDATP